ncbi:hypothetical protein BDV95DRAFT_624200 [Massariosphaeria phaeospora]|uniref:Uncharacterized protein n=1 Tax=Massariosphaeria phaeospora TaxID=100035 RepID=A0A7C8I0Y5_9PLEO|nr:hypothetical protein BDV95DRAFT_624200 [Massariosphaeria phaeospora]
MQRVPGPGLYPVPSIQRQRSLRKSPRVAAFYQSAEAAREESFLNFVVEHHADEHDEDEIPDYEISTVDYVRLCLSVNRDPVAMNDAATGTPTYVNRETLARSSIKFKNLLSSAISDEDIEVEWEDRQAIQLYAQAISPVMAGGLPTHALDCNLDDVSELGILNPEQIVTEKGHYSMAKLWDLYYLAKGLRNTHVKDMWPTYEGIFEDSSNHVSSLNPEEDESMLNFWADIAQAEHTLELEDEKGYLSALPYGHKTPSDDDCLHATKHTPENLAEWLFEIAEERVGDQSSSSLITELQRLGEHGILATKDIRIVDGAKKSMVQKMQQDRLHKHRKKLKRVGEDVDETQKIIEDFVNDLERNCRYNKDLDDELLRMGVTKTPHSDDISDTDDDDEMSDMEDDVETSNMEDDAENDVEEKDDTKDDTEDDDTENDAEDDAEDTGGVQIQQTYT